MPPTRRSLVLPLLAAWLGLVPRAAQAIESAYVYVAANPDHSPNSVAALRTSAGSTSIVPGSPFATGGLGLAPSTGTEFAHRITIARSRTLLFVANDGSGTISAFAIDRATGRLSAVPGSPFVINGWNAFAGISLAASQDGRFLYASGPSIVGLSVAANGALSEIGARWAFTQRAPGIAIDPNNARLFLSMAGGIVILHAGEGGLTADPPEIVSVGSTASDLALNSAGTRFWVSTKAAGIQAYNYGATGISFVPGSPFFGELTELGGLTLDGKDRFLVAFSGLVPRLLAARTNVAGSLELSPGSATRPAVSPLTATLSPDASLLLSADGLGQIDAWTAASDGALGHIAGYPIPSGAGPGFPSMATISAPTPAPAAPRWLTWFLVALLPLTGLIALRQSRVASCV